MTTHSKSRRADLASAWGIGVGIGLIALQLTWLVGARIAGLLWPPPQGPTIAFLASIIVGVLVAVVSGKRLAAQTVDSLIPGPADREVR